MKKSSMLAAVSAFAVIAGFAAQPASATDWGRICDNCGVDWHFTNRDVDLTIDPDEFDLSAITSVCSDQLFGGSLISTANASGINSGEFSNTASSVANVISVVGDADVNDGKSPFSGVVDAVQRAYGTLAATATAGGVNVYGATEGVANTFSNTATAAANVISLDTTKLAFVDADQDAGSWWHPITLNSTATAGGVNMISGGDFANTASSVANVVSVNVSPASFVKPQPNGNDRNRGGGDHDYHDLIKPVSLALVDVSQTAFANMTSLASATAINTSGGAFANSATSAANVISVINKK